MMLNRSGHFARQQRSQLALAGFVHVRDDAFRAFAEAGLRGDRLADQRVDQAALADVLPADQIRRDRAIASPLRGRCSTGASASSSFGGSRAGQLDRFGDELLDVCRPYSMADGRLADESQALARASRPCHVYPASRPRFDRQRSAARQALDRRRPRVQPRRPRDRSARCASCSNRRLIARFVSRGAAGDFVAQPLGQPRRQAVAADDHQVDRPEERVMRHDDHGQQVRRRLGPSRQLLAAGQVLQELARAPPCRAAWRSTASRASPAAARAPRRRSRRRRSGRSAPDRVRHVRLSTSTRAIAAHATIRRRSGSARRGTDRPASRENPVHRVCPFRSSARQSSPSSPSVDLARAHQVPRRARQPREQPRHLPHAIEHPPRAHQVQHAALLQAALELVRERVDVDSRPGASIARSDAMSRSTSRRSCRERREDLVAEAVEQIGDAIRQVRDRRASDRATASAEDALAAHSRFRFRRRVVGRIVARDREDLPRSILLRRVVVDAPPALRPCSSRTAPARSYRCASR